MTKRDVALKIYDKIKQSDLGRKDAKKKYGIESHEYLKIIFHSKAINAISWDRLWDICGKLKVGGK